MGNLPEEGDVLARFRRFQRDAVAQQFQYRRIVVWKTNKNLFHATSKMQRVTTQKPVWDVMD
jgi:hypothetical protein